MTSATQPTLVNIETSRLCNARAFMGPYLTLEWIKYLATIDWSPFLAFKIAIRCDKEALQPPTCAQRLFQQIPHDLEIQ